MTGRDPEPVEHLAPRLGDDAAARLDVEAIVSGVTARLRSEAARAPWRRAVRWAVGVAAALAIVVGGDAWWHARGAPSTDLALGTPWVDPLTEIELDEVLDSLTMDIPVSELMPATLDDLTEPQLQELLAMLEG